MGVTGAVFTYTKHFKNGVPPSVKCPTNDFDLETHDHRPQRQQARRTKASR